MSLGTMSLGTMSLGTMSLGTMSLGTMSLGTMSLGTMSLGTMSLGTMSLGKKSLGKKSLGKMMKPWITDRRQFGMALGLGLFAPLSARGEQEVLSASQSSELEWQLRAEPGEIFEHWTPEEDATWKWYRLERFTNGEWESIGISLPVDKLTDQPYQPADGYLSAGRIPKYVQRGELPRIPQARKKRMAPSQFERGSGSSRAADPEIQSRDGRPPSEWLRSLYAEELRTWLPIADAPEASVSGMTFWVHLIRDHSFDPRRIEGLTEHEFKLLHSAAHHGY